MANNYLNMIRIPRQIFSVKRDLKIQRKFINDNISSLLNQYEQINDGSLSAKDFKKINKYYGLAVPAILGEAFCRLRGFEMNDLERLVSTSQGVVTGLFDDFFDDGNISQEDIIEMLENPKSYVCKNIGQKLIVNFYIKAVDNSIFPERVQQGALDVFDAQIMSKKQEISSITNSIIWDITKRKGGVSVLFYRYGFKHELKEGEKEALYQLGVLMQLENDIFDTYKDFQSGIYTLPTTTDKIVDLKNLYTEQTNLFIDLSYKMNYPTESIRLFLDRLMPVINRAYVCFYQYQKIENINKSIFDVSKFSRKQLICDMENPFNFLRTIFYQIRSDYLK